MSDAACPTPPALLATADPEARMLPPGTHRLRRGDGRVQLGLAPGTAVVLPEDHPTAQVQEPALSAQTVRRVAAGVGPGGEDPSTSPWSPHRIAGLLRRLGDDAPAASDRLSRTNVQVEAFGPPVRHALRATAEEVLARAGLRVADRRPLLDAPLRLGLALGVGEPPRELLDSWMRSGVPHLVLRLVEGSVLLGPFVLPGTTPCLRCVDAHHADADPSWPLLVAQYSRLTRRDRHDGVPEPLDPGLATLALGWATRDLSAYVEGGRPATWSSTIRLPANLDALETTSWLRHPECGCSWGTV